MNPQRVAANVRTILAAHPERYRYFGVYWYFIKALLKMYYSRDQLYLLGDYEDPDAKARIPAGAGGDEVLRLALEEYETNARAGEPPRVVFDHEGDRYEIFDEDAGL